MCCLLYSCDVCSVSFKWCFCMLALVVSCDCYLCCMLLVCFTSYLVSDMLAIGAVIVVFVVHVLFCFMCCLLFQSCVCLV